VWAITMLVSTTPLLRYKQACASRRARAPGVGAAQEAQALVSPSRPADNELGKWWHRQGAHRWFRGRAWAVGEARLSL
jgi:hypothetical protein